MNIEMFHDMDVLLEGGNAKAIDDKGNEVLAQKMDLLKVPRANLKKELMDVFTELDHLYFKEFKEKLWEPFSIVSSGLVFNGSSTYLFDDNITDAEFTKYKSKVGDVDITVDSNKKENMFILLKKLKGKTIANMKFIGHKLESSTGPGKAAQFNTVFRFDTEDGHTLFPQIDFEFTSYTDNKPTDWAKFGHSSDWADIKMGFKGVNHKFALVNIARVLSKEAHKFPNVMIPKGATDTDFVVTTGKPFVEFVQSTKSDEQFEYLDKDEKFKKFSINDFVHMTNDEILQAFKSHKAKGTESKIEKSITTAVSKSAKYDIPTFLAFSVDRGVRLKFIQVLTADGKPVAIDGKPLFAELETEKSTYIQELTTIFELLFGFKPSNANLKQLNSFVGVIDLMKHGNYEDKMGLYTDFLTRVLDTIWHHSTSTTSKENKATGEMEVKTSIKRAQELERDSMEEDMRIKWSMVNYIIGELGLTSMKTKAKEAAESYYANWQGGADDTIVESIPKRASLKGALFDVIRNKKDRVEE